MKQSITLFRAGKKLLMAGATYVATQCAESRSVFETYRRDIAKENLRILKSASQIGVVLFCALCVVELMMAGMDQFIPIYFLLAVVTFLSSILFRQNLMQQSKVLLPAAYSFFIICLSCMLYISVFLNPGSLSVTFVVFLVIFPFLLLDEGVRINAFLAVWVLTFCIFAFWKEPRSIAMDNTINCVFLSLFGSFVGFSARKTKLDNIKMRHSLSVQVAIDPLTKLYNRRKLEQDFSRYRELGQHKYFSILILDIDYFKNYNDYYGHPMGDDCLRRIGVCLSDFARQYGFICYRYGGEEFLMTSSEHDYNSLGKIARQLVRLVESLRISHSASAMKKVTVSIGYAERKACDAQDLSALIGMADKALYGAKYLGRNAALGYLNTIPIHSRLEPIDNQEKF